MDYYDWDPLKAFLKQKIIIIYLVSNMENGFIYGVEKNIRCS